MRRRRYPPPPALRAPPHPAPHLPPASCPRSRRNRSVGALNENAARLKAYVAKLVVEPLAGGKRKPGKAARQYEVSRADFAAIVAKGPERVAAAAPIRQPAPVVTFAAVTADMVGDKHSAYKTLRQERTNKKLAGRRKARAAKAPEAPAAAAAE